MTRFYKVKLNTTPKIDRELTLMSGTYRKIFNTVVETLFNNAISVDKKHITGTDIRNLMVKQRSELFPYAWNMDGGILNSASFRASESFNRWWDNYDHTSYRKPKFLSRKKSNKTFKTTGKVKIFYNYIEVPKLGKIKLCESGYIPQGKAYSNITFSNDGEHWWISLEVREREEIPSSDSYTGKKFLNISANGDITCGGELLLSPIYSRSYLKAQKKQKALKKKFKRQVLANMVYTKLGVKKARTSRNMLKTKNSIVKVDNRLKAIRKDSFKKQASLIARTKLKELTCLSPLSIKVMKQGALTRMAREKHALEFYNMIKKRAALEGTVVSEYTFPSCLVP